MNALLRILTTREPGDAVLFEPLLDRWLAEQLLWRRGRHLWETAESSVETLLALRERTGADAIAVDARPFSREDPDLLFSAMERRWNGVCPFVLLTDDGDTAKKAGRYPCIAAVGAFGGVRSDKPVIQMDGTAEEAVKAKAAGWFAPEKAEEVWRDFSGEIAILGGLGVDELTSHGPATIRQRCEDLFAMTQNVRFAIGSGGVLPKEHYLTLITLLGAVRDNQGGRGGNL